MSLKYNEPTPARAGNCSVIPSKGLLVLELTLGDGSKEPYFINCRHPKARGFALFELASAMPSKLKLGGNPDAQIAALLSGEAEGQEVTITKIRQETDPTRFNLRLTPQFKNAEIGDLLNFARSLMATEATEATETTECPSI